MKHLVVFTGAGMSAESGLKTFRDSGGLWENHRIEDVATPMGWEKNKAMVLEFYNQRRAQNVKAKPNPGHYGLAALEDHFKVSIITQNIDNLHERAGSSNVLHLHGEIMKSRSTFDPSLIYDIKGSLLNIGDKCEKGSQLRPNIVWFGEAVPEMDNAYRIASKADIFVVIGSSLVVYPAACLIDYVPAKVPKYIIDPNEPFMGKVENVKALKTTAAKGVKLLSDDLINKYQG